MKNVKNVHDWMNEKNIDLEKLEQDSALDRKILEAIIHGRYTPSPQQRQRVAAALGIKPDQITWGHVAEISHVYGHGPQFGRSP